MVDLFKRKEELVQHLGSILKLKFVLKIESLSPGSRVKGRSECLDYVSGRLYFIGKPDTVIRLLHTVCIIKGRFSPNVRSLICPAAS